MDNMQKSMDRAPQVEADGSPIESADDVVGFPDVRHHHSEVIARTIVRSSGA